MFNGKTHYFDWAIFHSYVSHYQRVVNNMENCHYDHNIRFFFWPGIHSC